MRGALSRRAVKNQADGLSLPELFLDADFARKQMFLRPCEGFSELLQAKRVDGHPEQLITVSIK